MEDTHQITPKETTQTGLLTAPSRLCYNNNSTSSTIFLAARILHMSRRGEPLFIVKILNIRQIGFYTYILWWRGKK